MRARQTRRKTRNGDAQSEGRRHPRVLLNLPIEYYATATDLTRPGHTFNVGPEGVMLNIPERLNIGQMISLAIFFSLGRDLEAIKVNSLVVWVDDAKREGSYRSGVKFLDLSPTDLSKLGKFFEEY